MPGGSAPERVPFQASSIYMKGREICYLGREGCSVMQWVFVQKAVILLQKVIRDFKIQRRGRQRERQKNNWFN